ncbi:MAG: hypothetical protein WJ306_04695 [Ferrovum myxofaciens]
MAEVIGDDLNGFITNARNKGVCLKIFRCPMHIRRPLWKPHYGV